jgi:hypothetical protein
MYNNHKLFTFHKPSKFIGAMDYIAAKGIAQTATVEEREHALFIIIKVTFLGDETMYFVGG